MPSGDAPDRYRTQSIEDAEWGGALLWPPTRVTVRQASWGDIGDEHFEIEGDEHWDSEGDDNNFYARCRDEWIAVRMVAAWNACYGVPTADLLDASSGVTRRLADLTDEEPRANVNPAYREGAAFAILQRALRQLALYRS